MAALYTSTNRADEVRAVDGGARVGVHHVPALCWNVGHGVWRVLEEGEGEEGAGVVLVSERVRPMWHLA